MGLMTTSNLQKQTIQKLNSVSKEEKMAEQKTSLITTHSAPHFFSTNEYDIQKNYQQQLSTNSHNSNNDNVETGENGETKTFNLFTHQAQINMKE
eukprot:Pgem_evm1s15525